jgi:uncharacterized cupin superfamily protein
MPVFTQMTVDVETISASETPTGAVRRLLFSDSGGLSQFGAYVETLPPGSRSSLCHWHAREDEMVYMLTGQVTLHEGGVAVVLQPGQAATFKAGEPLGHFLQNDTEIDASYLVIGTRSGKDTVTYPDHDRVKIYDDTTGEKRFTTLDGASVTESAYAIPGA